LYAIEHSLNKAVRDRMFLGMQDFDFAQITQEFGHILPKFTQKKLLGDAAAS